MQRRHLLSLAAFAVLLASCRSTPTDGQSPRTDDGAFEAASVDHLAFLEPFLAGRFDRTLGSGADAFEVRVTTTAVLPGVLATMQTDAFLEGRWQRVVEATFGHDPRRDVVVYRGWTIDGAYMDGTAHGTSDGDVVIDFELTEERGLLSLRQRFEFEGPGRCSWVTLTTDDEARLFDAGEMRRAVSAPAAP